MKKNRLARLMMLGLVLAAAAGISARASEKTPETQAPHKTCRILTTIYPLQIMAMNIARDVPGAQVANMVSPETGCLHHYNLTPEDLKTLANADILIVNGAGMETFLEDAFKLVPKERVITATQGVELISDEHGPNPHVWVSPAGAAQQARVIAEGLARLAPENAAAFQSNAEAYIARLNDLGRRMNESLAGMRNRPVVTFHEAFPYFAREFGLNIVAVVESEPGVSPGARELAGVIRTIRKAGVKAIFTEPQYPSAVARTLAGETGAKVYTLDPAATGPVRADAYFEIMERNLAVLEEALKGDGR